MPTTRGRLVFNNVVIYDQADFFQSDGYTRVTGIVPSGLLCEVYYNNALQAWPVVSGAGVLESQVAAGSVYWDALPGGHYGVRWRPNAVGFWRVFISYIAGTQIVAQDYDVSSGTAVTPPGGGLRASFTG
jgi:hypothetical protein